MPLEKAKEMGAMALFNEAYGQTVRVMCFGDFSMELCGGTHVQRSGDIGLFKQVAESSVAAGIRRIEALTGEKAFACIDQASVLLSDMAALLKTCPGALKEKLQQHLQCQRSLEQKNKRLTERLAALQQLALSNTESVLDGVHVIVSHLPELPVEGLRSIVHNLKERWNEAVILLATVEDNGKLVLIAGVTPSCTHRLAAPEVLNRVAKSLGGSGGGRADFAQGGAPHAKELDRVLEETASWVKERLLSSKVCPSSH